MTAFLTLKEHWNTWIRWTVINWLTVHGYETGLFLFLFLFYFNI